MTFCQSILPNGIKIITDPFPHVNSVSIHVFIKVGSRSEVDTNSGVAHFLEHMVFKGTENRKSSEILKEFDDIGGCFNAYTSRETTCYYTTVLKKDISKALELISDMLINSVFDVSEIESEKLVVLQELARSCDDPDDLLYDKYFETIYPSSFGAPILGNEDTINNFNRDLLFDFFRKNYVAGNTIVSVSGDVDHKEVSSLVEKHFSLYPEGDVQSGFLQPEYNGKHYVKSKDLSQLHMIIGFKGFHYVHSDYYKSKIGSIILGGGMSSRLFQEVREKRGLAYSVSAIASSYSDTGVFNISVGISPEKAPELLDVVFKEIETISSVLCSESELARAKSQLKSRILMGRDKTSYRSSMSAHYVLFHGRNLELDEIVDEIDSISVNDVRSVFKSIVDTEMSFGALGDVSHIPSNFAGLNIKVENV